MELFRSGKKTRIITPFPDLDPNFRVHVHKLPPGLAARLQDRNGVNQNKPSAVKFEKFLQDIYAEAIERVEGLTENGVPMDPVARETKLALRDMPCEVDGDTTNVLVHVLNLADEEEREEAKNSLRPSAISSATA